MSFKIRGTLVQKNHSAFILGKSWFIPVLPILWNGTFIFTAETYFVQTVFKTETEANSRNRLILQNATAFIQYLVKLPESDKGFSCLEKVNVLFIFLLLSTYPKSSRTFSKYLWTVSFYFIKRSELSYPQLSHCRASPAFSARSHKQPDNNWFTFLPELTRWWELRAEDKEKAHSNSR